MCLKELCYCLREPIVDGDRSKPTKARPEPKLPKSTNMPDNTGEIWDSNGKFTSHTPPKKYPRISNSSEEESSGSPLKNDNRGVGSYSQPQRNKNEVHSKIQDNVSDAGFASKFERDAVDKQMLNNNNRGVGSYTQPQTTTTDEVHSRIQDNGFASKFEAADSVEKQMLKKVGRTDIDSNGHAMAKSQAKTNYSYARSVESTQTKNEVKYPF